jgi:hypothetical protein
MAPCIAEHSDCFSWRMESSHRRYSSLPWIGVHGFYFYVLQLILGFYSSYLKKVLGNYLRWFANMRHTIRSVYASCSFCWWYNTILNALFQLVYSAGLVTAHCILSCAPQVKRLHGFRSGNLLFIFCQHPVTMHWVVLCVKVWTVLLKNGTRFLVIGTIFQQRDYSMLHICVNLWSEKEQVMIFLVFARRYYL